MLENCAATLKFTSMKKRNFKILFLSRTTGSLQIGYQI